MSNNKKDIVVQSTTDYGRFKSLAGNRVVNPLHVQRLTRSFREEYLISPIIVNERFEIIDGQHRFAAAMSESLPVYFILIDGYRLPQVQRLNTSTSNWKKVDYLNSYADLGVLPYVQMKRFMGKFPTLGFSASECLLTQNVGGINNKGRDSAGKRNFQQGDLVIVDLEFAHQAALKILEISKHYEGYNRSAFVRSISMLMQKPVFDIDYFIGKLERYSSMFSDRQSVNEYIILIEEVYNYRKRDPDNLRF
jgi:hypothetical protein